MIKDYLKLVIHKLAEGAQKRPLLALAISVALLFILIISIGAIGSSIGNSRARKQYEKQTKENEKKIQAALLEAEKRAKLAEAALQQSEEIRRLNDQRRDLRNAKDAQLDKEISQTQKEAEQQKQQIEQNYKQNLDSINNMPDEQRSADICARLSKLAESNPEFNQFKCN